MTVFFYKNRGSGMEELKKSIGKFVESYKTGQPVID